MTMQPRRDKAGHGRSVTEIWGRDETKNRDLGGGGRNQRCGLLGDENSNMVSCIHEKLKSWSCNGKNVKESDVFSRAFWFKHV